MKKIFLTMALALGLIASAQVKIGTNPTTINAGSLLELESSTQGVVFPRIALTNTTTATLAGGSHVQGMTVYNTANTSDVTEGLYTNDGAKWVKVGTPTTVSALNVTAEQTGNYTALATDDIILMSPTATVTLTLPTTGVIIGKKFYVSNKSLQTINIIPLVREGTTQTLYGEIGYTIMYVGGTGNGSYAVISGQ